VCDGFLNWDKSDGFWIATGWTFWCYEGETGGGGGGFTPPDPGGGGRNPQQLAYPYAKAIQDFVSDGIMTDCQGLATFAASMATIASSVSDFVKSFGVLVPYVPGEELLGINWNEHPVTLGVTGKSGFVTQFQEGYGTAAGPNGDDQAHHFAAFFQAGFFNLTNATAAAYAWEGQNGFKNQGDIGLGLAAATLGGLVRSGVIKPVDVAENIRKGLCAH
jgi:hypothetical protein